MDETMNCFALLIVLSYCAIVYTWILILYCINGTLPISKNGVHGSSRDKSDAGGGVRTVAV